MKKPLRRVIDYFFPPVGHTGKKVSDLRWFQKFALIAPYTVLGIAAIIFIWGLFAHFPGRFFLKPQFITLFGIVFWLSLLSIAVKLFRKRQRDPSFFLLISNFIALRGLLGLCLFSFATYQLETKQQILSKNIKTISQEVQDQIQSHRKFWDDHSARLRQKSQEIQDNVHTSLRNLDQRMDSGLDRFNERLRREDKLIQEQIKKSREESRKMHEKMTAYAHKCHVEKSNQMMRDWCRTHPLSRMCDNLPPEESDSKETHPNTNNKTINP